MCRQSNQHISHSSNTFQVCTGCLRFATGKKILMLWKTTCLLCSLAITVLIQKLVFHGSIPLAGKNVIRPGNYIRQLLEAPEKNYQPIHQFTSSTLRDAFSLRVGPVPGVSNNDRTPISDFEGQTCECVLTYFLFVVTLLV